MLRACWGLGFVLFTLAVTRASAQKINLPPVTRSLLPNGMHLVLMEYHRAPTLSIIAFARAGSAADPPGKAGTAALTVELLRRGTKKRTAPQIAEEIDFLGGSLSTDVGKERVMVSMEVLSKDAEVALELLADIMRHPTFPPEELERVRQLRLAALQSLRDEPEAVARRVAEEVAFAGHPYGHLETLSSLQAITRDDLVAFYRRYIVPSAIALVAVGDFRTPELAEKLRRYFADWSASSENTPQIPPVKAGPIRKIVVDKPDAVQTHLRLVRTAFPRNSPDYFASQIAEAILGGGFTSRLVEEVRVRRALTYGISGGFRPELHGGRFVVTTFTKVDTTRRLLDVTLAVLRKVAARGFTPEELRKVKGYLGGLFAIRIQAPEVLAAELAEMAFYHLPEDYLHTYLQKLQRVSLAEVNRIARLYFAPETLSMVLVGPRSKIEPQLKKLGNFEGRSVVEIGK
jgi:zinc protease